MATVPSGFESAVDSEFDITRFPVPPFYNPLNLPQELASRSMIVVWKNKKHWYSFLEGKPFEEQRKAVLEQC